MIILQKKSTDNYMNNKDYIIKDSIKLENNITNSKNNKNNLGNEDNLGCKENLPTKISSKFEKVNEKLDKENINKDINLNKNKVNSYNNINLFYKILIRIMIKI